MSGSGLWQEMNFHVQQDIGNNVARSIDPNE